MKISRSKWKSGYDVPKDLPLIVDMTGSNWGNYFIGEAESKWTEISDIRAIEILKRRIAPDLKNHHKKYKDILGNAWSLP